MRREPIVLPILGVIFAPDINPDDVVSAANDELFAIALKTKSTSFGFTDYYRNEMGRGLTRLWCAGDCLAPASALADYKSNSVELEGRWRRNTRRRINLDPGYITAHQMVLATTKQLPQAVYLRDGIYAVIELLYRDGAFAVLPWTYPDYRWAAAEKLFDPFRSRFLNLRRGPGERKP